MKRIILGGGFLGQLLHTLFPEARVFDWRPAPPMTENRAFGPQYLWEPLPRVRCHEITVLTSVDGQTPDADRIRAYKRKVGKEQDNADWLTQFQPRMPGYLPDLPPTTFIEYGRRVHCINVETRMLIMGKTEEPYDELLSTIPLYAMLQLCPQLSTLLRPDIQQLDYRPIYIETTPCVTNESVMAVDYLSDPDEPVYRQTMFRSLRYRESLEPQGAQWTKLLPGKIYAGTYTEDLVRLLGLHGVHCFGRYAAWRPEELAHDTYRQARQWKESRNGNA